jgi:PAS domain-containing protein
MARPNLAALLSVWRQAEARWEHARLDDPDLPHHRLAVLTAWESYNRAAGAFAEDEVVLVADDSMTYVGVFGPTEAMLGWTNDELRGRTIADITPPDSVELMETSWRDFVMAGRLEGVYPLWTRDGRIVVSRFTAWAHRPVAGLHLSRHRPNDSLESA